VRGGVARDRAARGMIACVSKPFQHVYLLETMSDRPSPSTSPSRAGFQSTFSTVARSTRCGASRASLARRRSIERDRRFFIERPAIGRWTRAAGRAPRDARRVASRNKAPRGDIVKMPRGGKETSIRARARPTLRDARARGAPRRRAPKIHRFTRSSALIRRERPRRAVERGANDDDGDGEASRAARRRRDAGVRGVRDRGAVRARAR